MWELVRKGNGPRQKRDITMADFIHPNVFAKLDVTEPETAATPAELLEVQSLSLQTSPSRSSNLVKSSGKVISKM